MTSLATPRPERQIVNGEKRFCSAKHTFKSPFFMVAIWLVIAAGRLLLQGCDQMLSSLCPHL
ncbi:hypothetical protein B0H13DRAFT_2304015 [Mycena leptocephala]|nr:hypothetical protein B0H13DRAFT_2304015 [Mycena leptocephala]